MQRGSSVLSVDLTDQEEEGAAPVRDKQERRAARAVKKAAAKQAKAAKHSAKRAAAQEAAAAAPAPKRSKKVRLT